MKELTQIHGVYDYRLVVISVLLAIVISVVGMLLIPYAQKKNGTATKIGVAMVLALAIPLMHYTAMAAVGFYTGHQSADFTWSVGSYSVSHYTILVITFAVLGFVVVSSLIDRRLSEQQSMMDDERRMLRAMIDNIPDFLFVIDRQGRFVMANAYAAHALGTGGVDDLIGQTVFDVCPKNLAMAYAADNEQVMQSGLPLLNREEEGRDREGNKTYLLTTKVPLRGADGHVTGVVGVARDISKRKRNEDALREAERKYRGLFDEAMVGMFQSTPEGRFVSVNRAMAKIFGFPSPEAMIEGIGDIAQLYVEPKHYRDFLVVMDRLGSILSLECEAYRKDGTRIWIACSGRTVRDKRMVVRYEGMMEDITERKLLRAQLLQAQKLESIGQLAAGIAHEINSPTQYIGDNVRFLKESFGELAGALIGYERLLTAARSGPLADDVVRQVVEEVERVGVSFLMEEIPKAIDQTLEGVNRVSTLVGAMKEFSHPGTKEKIPLDLNHAIASTITVARNEWKYVAEMETHFDATMPLVPCQPGEFNQVILNLIINAAHAIGDVVGKNGSTKGKIRVLTLDYPDHAEIRLQDSGTGIPEKVRARIFDPFFTTKEIGKGTGQGLAIARSVVVDKHDGSIDFETEEGKGTTFIIRLPKEGKVIPTKANSLAGREAAGA